MYHVAYRLLFFERKTNRSSNDMFQFARLSSQYRGHYGTRIRSTLAVQDERIERKKISNREKMEPVHDQVDCHKN